MRPQQTSATAPEPIITAEDLLKKMRAGIKEVYSIFLREQEIPVRILSNDEMNAIRRDAIRNVKISSGDDVDKNVIVQKSVLRMASSTDKGAPLLGDRLLSILSVDEINYLYNEYMKVMDDVNPELETISNERFRALVDAVKKKEISARDCSLKDLRAIFTSWQDMMLQQDTQTSQTVS